jgi:hypothetical protein
MSSRKQQETSVEPRFRLARGERWHRGARVSKRVAVPQKRATRK